MLGASKTFTKKEIKKRKVVDDRSPFISVESVAPKLLRMKFRIPGQNMDFKLYDHTYYLRSLQDSGHVNT